MITVRLHYTKIDNLTYPLMLHVCRNRGLETDRVHELFKGYCLNCKSVLNSYALMQIGDRLSMQSGSGIILDSPIMCMKCMHPKLEVQITSLSTEEKTVCSMMNIFKSYRLFQLPLNITQTLK